jgi:hypothetical protein
MFVSLLVSFALRTQRNAERATPCLDRKVGGVFFGDNHYAHGSTSDYQEFERDYKI